MVIQKMQYHTHVGINAAFQLLHKRAAMENMCAMLLLKTCCHIVYDLMCQRPAHVERRNRSSEMCTLIMFAYFTNIISLVLECEKRRMAILCIQLMNQNKKTEREKKFHFSAFMLLFQNDFLGENFLTVFFFISVCLNAAKFRLEFFR